MNWNYISGFFDADGSTSIIAESSKRNKSLQVSFHNNERIILETIQKFIFDELGFNGTISLKKSKNINHQDAYDLKYKYRQALEVANKMTILHPKKVHRFKTYNLIQKNTKRNGKYTLEEKAKRDKLLDLFTKH